MQQLRYLTILAYAVGSSLLYCAVCRRRESRFVVSYMFWPLFSRLRLSKQAILKFAMGGVIIAAVGFELYCDFEAEAQPWLAK